MKTYAQDVSPSICSIHSSRDIVRSLCTQYDPTALDPIAHVSHNLLVELVDRLATGSSKLVSEGGESV